jgi:GxxExxY protein
MVYRTQIHTDFHDSKHKTLTAAIISIFYKVYNTLGYGFLEKVYENAMMYEFKKAGIPAVSQAPIAVMYEDEIMGEYSADI